MDKRNILIALLGMFFLIDVTGDFGHKIDNQYELNPPVYNSMTGISCIQREVDALRIVGNATIQADATLAMSQAQAFDRLAELGQNC